MYEKTTVILVGDEKDAPAEHFGVDEAAAAATQEPRGAGGGGATALMRRPLLLLLLLLALVMNGAISMSGTARGCSSVAVVHHSVPVGVMVG